MSRPLILLSLLLLLLHDARAQQSKFSVGTGLGLNITNVSGYDDLPGVNGNDPVNLNQLRFYTLFGYRFAKNFVILAEPAYEEKGFKQTGLLELVDDSGNVNVENAELLTLSHYITLPLTLNFTAGNKIRLNAGAGPFLAFLLETKFRLKSLDSENAYEDVDVTSQYNSVDYGIVGRLSVEFRLISFLSIEVGAHYMVSLPSIYVDDVGQSLKNRSIYAGAGLRFYLAGGSKEE